MLRWIGTLTLALLSGGFALGADDAAAQTPKRGGILNFAVVASPPSYDCHAETTFAVVHPVAPHYSLLLKIDPANYPNVAGDLAESWSVSADGLVYTIKLHKGVKFHDGSPLTSADVKATYERIIRPPAGVISVRKSYYEDFGDIETPDDTTVIFKMKAPVAGVLELLASPFNCIYSAAKLKSSPNYPGARDHGLGRLRTRRARAGLALDSQALRGLFQAGPALPRRLQGLLREVARRRARACSAASSMPSSASARRRSATSSREARQQGRGPPTAAARRQHHHLQHQEEAVRRYPRAPGPHARHRPLDRRREHRQDLVAAISGGVSRPGSKMALPEEELAKLPGYWKDAEAARTEARRLLKEAGQENLAFKFLNRAGIESYTTGGIYAVDQWRRVGLKATHEQLETKMYQENLATGNYEVGMEFISDYLDDPTQNFVKFLSKALTPLGYSGHEDGKIDALYEKQRRMLDPVERTKVVRELDRYVLTTAYSVPFLWSQRIVALPTKVKGWHMTPTHYLSQDLVEVWLDQ